MADYKIVCTDQLPLSQPTKHAHIVAVGIDTDSDGYADEKHSKQLVIDNIRLGHRYYTRGVTSDEVAFVEVVKCSRGCGYDVIRSTPDAVRDNNLDYIRRCSWSS